MISARQGLTGAGLRCLLLVFLSLLVFLPSAVVYAQACCVTSEGQCKPLGSDGCGNGESELSDCCVLDQGYTVESCMSYCDAVVRSPSRLRNESFRGLVLKVSPVLRTEGSTEMPKHSVAGKR